MMEKDEHLCDPCFRKLDLFWDHVETEINKAGIKVFLTTKGYVVVTIEEIPKKTRSRLLKYARKKGFPIEFEVAQQGDEFYDILTNNFPPNSLYSKKGYCLHGQRGFPV